MNSRRHRASETRAESLRGRTSPRRHTRQQPRQSITVGMPVRPKPDPRLKAWPTDCVQIACAGPATVNVAGIRGRIVDQVCADCHARIVVDSQTIVQAWAMPERHGRPLRFIGVDCCFSNYSLAGVQITDRRRLNE
jgi:hypothetical protein